MMKKNYACSSLGMGWVVDRATAISRLAAHFLDADLDLE